ncbi:MAG: amino acid permease [Vicinamibacteria bacterium]|nr:amino acid permease [Vicinamibacteria bacterium]
MAEPSQRDLIRGLSFTDATLITVGSVLGSGAFLTTTDVARALPHAGLILLAWLCGGVLTIAGALTYAELGTMMPRAGGPYHFLKEAYGPLFGFLKGWVDFLVIMSGALAAIAMGFGEYLGTFLPFFSTQNVLASAEIFGHPWKLTGGAIAGVLAIVFFTITSMVGLRESALIQNILTSLKIGAMLALALLGLFAAPVASPEFGASAMPPSLLSAFGVAMIGVLWTFDGWYCVTYLGGEMKEPSRDLPRAMFTGVGIVTVLYVLLNVVYLRAIPVSEVPLYPRIAEAAAVALFGVGAAKLVSAAVMVSTFGCIGATILYSTRTYLPMARDGVFFKSLAVVHPKWHTPVACILAQGAWTIILTLSGTYEALYTYVVVIVFLFHTAIGIAVFVLRAKKPDWPRPYRVSGYPWVPAVFVLTSLAFVLNSLIERPVESLFGFVILLLGIPAFIYWRRTAAKPS